MPIPRPAGSPLASVAGFGSLALFVDASGGTVVWNANVVIGSGPSPELTIDANGNITRAYNVTTQTTGNTISATVVAPTGGQVDFVGASGVSNSANPTFTFITPTQNVLIQNYSTKNLQIEAIDIASQGGGTPLVNLNSNSAGNFNFNIAHAATGIKPTTIDIENYGTSNVLLDGTINNPIGTTIIHNMGGDILLANASAVIKTNILDLLALGNIGTSSNRISAVLVESSNPADNSTRFTSSAQWRQPAMSTWI